MIDCSKQTKVDKTQSIFNRIGFLKHCSKLYETGTHLITDQEWDKEFYELQKIDPDNAFFEEAGGEIVDDGFHKTVAHKITMGSLSKSLSPELYFDFLKANYKEGDGSFLISHKIDGLSLSLLYQNGKLIQALTRGDSVQGIDVTENAKYIKTIPQTIPFKDEIEFRGEVYKNKQNFTKEKWTEQGYKNCRSFASGGINQKDPSVTGDRKLDFVCYEICRVDFASEVDKVLFIETQGFETLRAYDKLTKIGNSLEQVYSAVKAFMDGTDRLNLKWDVDGIVVKLNDCKKARAMGTTDGGKRPKAHRAVKYKASEVQTILLGVEDSVGRNGQICPVALLKPVDLDGSTIGRASLYNYANIRDSKDLKIGSIVKIAKKGDIIPQITGVVKEGSESIKLPTECPSCKTKLEWDENKVNLMCSNELCVSQLNARIEHWFDKLGTKGFGTSTIAKLTDKNALSWEGEPIISCISDMYWKLDNDRVVAHPFRKYNYLKCEMGDKTYENLLGSIKSVKEVTLAKFIEALGIGKIGRMAKDITGIAPTTDDIDKLTVQDITAIPGFGEIKAKAFLDGWKSLKGEINVLLKHIEIKQAKLASNNLSGMKFCFTGSFSKPREELQKMVVDNGGSVSSSVGKGVILCWDNEIQGGKYERAIKGGNQIISEKEFLKMIE